MNPINLIINIFINYLIILYQVIDNCNFVEINIDKYDIDNYRFEV